MRQTPTESQRTLVARLLVSLDLLGLSSSRLWQWKPSSMLELLEVAADVNNTAVVDEVVGICCCSFGRRGPFPSCCILFVADKELFMGSVVAIVVFPFVDP